jgi:hypothetical protein
LILLGIGTNGGYGRIQYARELFVAEATRQLMLSRDHYPNILVVDDESIHRPVRAAVLQRANYRVLTATDAAEAWSIFEHRRVRIDLFDPSGIWIGRPGRRFDTRLRNRDLQPPKNPPYNGPSERHKDSTADCDRKICANTGSDRARI